MHEYLARGLSPETLHDFMKQRLRWAGGAVEIFFYHNSIWRQVWACDIGYMDGWVPTHPTTTNYITGIAIENTHTYTHKPPKKGLNLKQKYLYFWAGLQALLGFPLLLVCVVPFIALADSSIAVRTYLLAYIHIYIPPGSIHGWMDGPRHT